MAFRTSSDEVNACLVVAERVTPYTEPAVTVVKIDSRMLSRHEGGDHDHEREERDECLPGECDAAIDELDLEHALPHPPEEQALQPSTEDSETLAYVSDSSTLVLAATVIMCAASPVESSPQKRMKANHVHLHDARPHPELLDSGRGAAWVSKRFGHRRHGPIAHGRPQGPGHGVGARRADYLLPFESP